MHWLVLNASAFALEEKAALRHLLQYILNGTVPGDDPLIRDIAAEVDRINDLDEEVKVFWTLEDEFKLQTKHKVQEAEQKAYAEGEARYNELVAMLIAENRLDDLHRVTVEPAYRETLFEELDIA